MDKVIFWDFDGTLVHPNERFAETLQCAMKGLGYDVSIDSIRAMFKNIFPWNNTKISYTDKTGDLWWESFLSNMNPFYIEQGIGEEAAALINEKFKTRMVNENTYILYDDAEETLSKCIEKGYKNYILSNNYPELDRIIKDFCLDKYFSGYFVSGKIGYEKPRRELYELALLEAGNPQIAYMVGDNPIADIEGSKKMGLTAIFVHKDEPSVADYTLENLSLIPALLK